MTPSRRHSGPAAPGDQSYLLRSGRDRPLLANIFLHYAFDLVDAPELPGPPWCRYADDRLVHCRTEQERKR